MGHAERPTHHHHHHNHHPHLGVSPCRLQHRHHRHHHHHRCGYPHRSLHCHRWYHGPAPGHRNLCGKHLGLQISQGAKDYLRGAVLTTESERARAFCLYAMPPNPTVQLRVTALDWQTAPSYRRAVGSAALVHHCAVYSPALVHSVAPARCCLLVRTLRASPCTPHTETWRIPSANGATGAASLRCPVVCWYMAMKKVPHTIFRRKHPCHY